MSHGVLDSGAFSPEGRSHYTDVIATGLGDLGRVRELCTPRVGLKDGRLEETARRLEIDPLTPATRRKRGAT
jgi:hypothetical protein